MLGMALKSSAGKDAAEALAAGTASRVKGGVRDSTLERISSETLSSFLPLPDDSIEGIDEKDETPAFTEGS